MKTSTIRSLLSEKGDVSTMRVMSIVSLAIGAGIAIYGIMNSKDLSGVAEITGVFVVSAFGGKVTQKAVEK